MSFFTSSTLGTSQLLLNDKLKSRARPHHTAIRQQKRSTPLPQPVTTATVLHCASLLQDEESTCDIRAIFLVDLSEGSAEKMRAEVKPGTSHCVPFCRGADYRAPSKYRLGWLPICVPLSAMYCNHSGDQSQQLSLPLFNYKAGSIRSKSQRTSSEMRINQGQPDCGDTLTVDVKSHFLVRCGTHLRPAYPSYVTASLKNKAMVRLELAPLSSKGGSCSISMLIPS